jgi:hypothetical protein
MRFFTSFRMTNMAFPLLRHSLGCGGEGRVRGIESGTLSILYAKFNTTEKIRRR